MRELNCTQAPAIVKSFLESMVEFKDEDVKATMEIGKVWETNIAPAFYHIKNCKRPACRLLWAKLNWLVKSL